MGSDYVGFLFEVMRNLTNVDCVGGYTTWTILKTIGLCILNGWVLCYLNYVSTTDTKINFLS